MSSGSGVIPSSAPAMNTTGNSRPFAAWNVRSVTLSARQALSLSIAHREARARNCARFAPGPRAASRSVSRPTATPGSDSSKRRKSVSSRWISASVPEESASPRSSSRAARSPSRLPRCSSRAAAETLSAGLWTNRSAARRWQKGFSEARGALSRFVRGSPARARVGSSASRTARVRKSTAKSENESPGPRFPPCASAPGCVH